MLCAVNHRVKPASCSLSVRLPLPTAATVRFPVHLCHICVVSFFCGMFIVFEGLVRVFYFLKSCKRGVELKPVY